MEDFDFGIEKILRFYAMTVYFVKNETICSMIFY